MQVVVRLDPAQRADRSLAAGPEQVALGCGLGLADRVALVLGQHVTDRGRELTRGLLDAVDLDKQHRARVGRITGAVVGFDSADCDLVHHLERRRDDAASDHGRNSLARGLDGRKGGEQRRDARRRAQQPHLDLGDGAERAFRPDEHSAKIEAHAVGAVTADPVHAAVREHNLHAEHVVRCDAVVQAMRAARVLGRVASDRAGLLARRIRRIEKVMRRRGQRQLLVHDAGLDQRGLGDGIDLEDASHAGHLQRDAAVNRDRAA